MKISIAQFIIGVVITPAIVYIFAVNQTEIQKGFWDYIWYGFFCVISFYKFETDEKL